MIYNIYLYIDSNIRCTVFCVYYIKGCNIVYNNIYIRNRNHKKKKTYYT